ncbi:MAG: hypothetical protein ACI9U0_002031, partial [Flavobacteriales bacterium]
LQLELELLDVIDRIRNQNKTLNIQTGSVFFTEIIPMRI